MADTEVDGSLKDNSKLGPPSPPTGRSNGTERENLSTESGPDEKPAQSAPASSLTFSSQLLRMLEASEARRSAYLLSTEEVPAVSDGVVREAPRTERVSLFSYRNMYVSVKDILSMKAQSVYYKKQM